MFDFFFFSFLFVNLSKFTEWEKQNDHNFHFSNSYFKEYKSNKNYLHYTTKKADTTKKNKNFQEINKIAAQRLE